jgi:hypothetical protein
VLRFSHTVFSVNGTFGAFLTQASADKLIVSVVRAVLANLIGALHISILLPLSGIDIDAMRVVTSP